jgi:nucleoside-diphosphate-sugar epimerase
LFEKDSEMNVFLTGASGYVGTALIRDLTQAGHHVFGLARSDEAAKKVAASGGVAVRGDLSDLPLLHAQAQRSDAVIHAGFEFNRDVARIDLDATQTLVAAQEGTNKPLIYTSGAWIYGPTNGKVADESTAPNVPPIYRVTGRADVETLVLAAAQRGVRSIITRGGFAYGRSGGPLNLFVSQLATARVLRHVGDGNNRFPSVHIDDFARAYTLALDKAPAGAIYNLTNGDDMRYRTLFQKLAAANSSAKDGVVSVEAWPLEDARKALAQFADAFTMDQLVSSERAKRELGWIPRAPTMAQEIDAGGYTSTSATV